MKIKLFLAIISVVFSVSQPASAKSEERTRYIHGTVLHEGLKRSYELYIPPVNQQTDVYPYTPKLLPLVIVLHGGGGNAQNVQNMTGFTEKAKQEGFAVVYPNGTSANGSTFLTWNAEHCCDYAMVNKVDDVGFIRLMINQIERKYPIDSKRIYVTGMSNGAMMAHRIGYKMPNKIAAIAPVVGALFGDERQPYRAVPTLTINGALDDSVPFEGGPLGGRAGSIGASDGTELQPSLYQGEFWASVNNCKSTPIVSSATTTTVWRYTCLPGREVIQYLVDDNGHAWPGGEKGSRKGDTPSQSMDATSVIWDFFKKHARK